MLSGKRSLVNFFESQLCRSRNFCVKCRTDPEWRQSVYELFSIPNSQFRCPYHVIVDGLGNIKVEVQKGTVKDKCKKQPLADEETQRKRLETCKKCEFLVGIKCKKLSCGCFDTTRLKFLNISCPDKKW